MQVAVAKRCRCIYVCHIHQVRLMRYLLGLLWSTCLVTAGCGMPIFVGEPVQELDVNSEDTFQKNLEAIRAMQGNRSSPALPALTTPEAEPVMPAGPAAIPRSQIPASPSLSGRTLTDMEALAKLPWKPSPSSPPSATDRLVPAYTIPAPMGPGSEGNVRCVPDGLGGQRCAAR